MECHICDNEVFSYGLVVMIRGFHSRGPGSVPGMGNTNFKQGYGGVVIRPLAFHL